MWSKPYHNAQIISVIWVLFFTGGTASFACRFQRLFPTYVDGGGVTLRMVPIPMVTLVATAVSVIIDFLHHANVAYQLYAALYEWRTGVCQPRSFTTAAFLDVYNGHVSSLRTIQLERLSAFHLMMRDIYMQAR